MADELFQFRLMTDEELRSHRAALAASVKDDQEAEHGSSTLFYLATPYKRYPQGTVEAFEKAARLAARLLRVGYCVYSPICHTHPIATLGGIDLPDYDWLAFDEHMMRACDAMLVAQMTGWRESLGVDYEIMLFERARKPVYYLNCETLEINAVCQTVVGVT